jgi:hypothetical protein
MLLKREFAMDESWIHLSDPESKEMCKEWKHVVLEKPSPPFSVIKMGQFLLITRSKEN